MSTAIFLAPRGNGGCDIELGDDHTRINPGYNNLVVFGPHGAIERIHTLSHADWGQLRDCVDQMLNQR